ncbi:zinc ABC transporter substrate-binding protein [Rhizobium sp. G21]|uniref:zinc ABC transporter substrate-binding protein n=1 Tax=Rhizobium sp. G21 TaxID=2758439 RepID=UPI001603175D|nr:zinc ABC transporter substrate-binding protein [Rhizobium sp. G21]MBB1250871.1 zinc ABC transporter substrate-binding protein [Rhizobium sp. G21]
MRFTLATAFASVSLLAFSALAAQAAPKVVVTIKPIHSLAASLMKGVGEPELLVDGVASPHTYQMKPSDASRLQEADVIFWVGHDMEKFMEKPLEALGGKARILELDQVEGLLKLHTREGGAFEAHDHGEEGHEHDKAGHEDGDHHHDADEKPDAGHDHDHAGETHEGHDHAAETHEHDHGEEVDLHLWLNTGNAKLMAAAMTKTLVLADPEHTQTYEKNLADLNASLDALSAEIKAEVAPVKDKPFIVFHDAYQYFEKEFGVKVAGSITVSPETMPGAARLKQIRAKVAELGSTCVFAEPQFEPKLVRVVLEGADAKSGVLDPEGGSYEKGEALYGDLMLGIARSLKDCLAAR